MTDKQTEAHEAALTTLRDLMASSDNESIRLAAAQSIVSGTFAVEVAAIHAK